MSEAEQKVDDNIDLEEIAASEGVVEENQQEEVQLTDIEQKAFDQGWNPKEDFNGPEDNWKTAKEFIRDGVWIQKLNLLKGDIDQQKANFETRMENSNKLHEARRKSDIEKLKNEQRNAVEVSDTEAYDKTQKQIDELEKEPAETQTVDNANDKHPEIAAWEQKNAWFNDLSDERGGVAVGIWNNYLQKNPSADIAKVLLHVDNRIDKLYPSNNSNPRRDQPNVTENNNKPAKRTNKSLSMSDLTSEERQDWNMFGTTLFKSEAEFLKTVADTRKQ